MDLPARISQETARQAAEDARHAVDMSLLELPISLSKILGYAVNVVLEDRKNKGTIRMYIEPNTTGVKYGFVLVR